MLPRSKRQRLSRPARLVQEVNLFAWQGLSEFGKKPKAAYARLTDAMTSIVITSLDAVE